MVSLPIVVPDRPDLVTSPPVKLRCPICRRQGIFPDIGGQDLGWNQHATDKDKAKNVVNAFQVGMRRCPAPDCHAPIFVVLKQGELVTSYPPEVLDFDTTDIPSVIAETMGEAVKCHASECFKAAAIMVRRTLEEISSDRGATGKNLKARIKDLGNKIVISKELLDAADELRILGNDAAHIEAKVYDEVGKEEIEVAIDLAKEILKAVYQHKSLIERLRRLQGNRAGNPR